MKRNNLEIRKFKEYLKHLMENQEKSNKEDNEVSPKKKKKNYIVLKTEKQIDERSNQTEPKKSSLSPQGRARHPADFRGCEK